MSWPKKLTLERLVAWVETVEPKQLRPFGEHTPEILEGRSQIQIGGRSRKR